MAASLLENVRQLHEDIEKAERVAAHIVSERQRKKAKYAPLLDHAIFSTLAESQAAARRLLNLYSDTDGLRADELAVLAGQKRSNAATPGPTIIIPPPPVAGPSTEPEPAAGSTASGSSTPAPSTTALLPPPAPVLSADSTVWMNFYDQLKVIRDAHKVNPTGPDRRAVVKALASTAAAIGGRAPDDVAAIAMTDENAAAALLRKVPYLAELAMTRAHPDKIFAPEEDWGRRVDMVDLHLKFVNIPKLNQVRQSEFKAGLSSRLLRKYTQRAARQATPAASTDDQIKAQVASEVAEAVYEPIDYVTYLKTFDEFASIPRYCKYADKPYKEYLEDLFAYLKGFAQRASPLTDQNQIVEHLEEQFEKLWSEKRLPGWSQLTSELPFFAVPTRRLFASQGTFDAHKSGSKFKKAAAALQKGGLAAQQEQIAMVDNEDMVLARLEFLIRSFKQILAQTIQRTIEYTERKQSRSLREIALEQQQETANHSDDENETALVLAGEKPAAAGDADDEEEDQDEPAVYNPLNLPLGWDGNPIPYWLYKLHGLGTEYKCEICGDATYLGRRAFERHFQEWRHALGMKCLGIPNTVHFKEITKVEDALQLFEKLRRDAEMQTFRPAATVEYEDSEGNIVSARAYEDMRRQGLL